ncbi:MFS transporter [Pseudomonas sp. TE3610]
MNLNVNRPSAQTPGAQTTTAGPVEGLLAAISFSALLAGTNAINPMLPLYQRVLHFTPLHLSLTFVCYVSALIGTLLLCSRPSITRRALFTLSMALVLAAMSDYLLSAANLGHILLGRLLVGIACGVGTGSATTLVVSALGAKGRTISTTGNLIGAVAGTALGQACALYWGDASMHVTFVIHGTTCLCLFLALSAMFRRKAKAPASHPVAHPAPKSALGPVLRKHRATLIKGALSWVLISLSIVTLPSLYAAEHMPYASSLGVIVLLVACAASQLSSPWLPHHLKDSLGPAASALGAVLSLTSSWTGISCLALAGFTALTYACAAAAVLLAGLIGTSVGLATTVYGIFSALGVSLAGLTCKALQKRHGSNPVT